MTELLKTKFIERFHQEPLVVRAPGRINLIGEHTDYNNGFVMPAAIDKAVTLFITASGTDESIVIANDVSEEQVFSVTALHPSEDWSTYIKGVIHGFQQQGHKPGGIHAVFTSDIPIGAGLSSSAALSCGFAFAINELFNFNLDRLALARIAQYAEHTFAGVKCGIMDQYASLFGKKDSVILLDCRNLTHEFSPLHLTEHTLLLVDTKVKHSLASSAYNKRRESCEEGVRSIQQKNPGVKSLRDVSSSLLLTYKDKLSEETFKRCSFIVGEIERTQKAAVLLKENKLQAFGLLMYETHEGLSNYYEVSCKELDVFVRVAKQEGITGARMMGGGFGGCTINIVQNGKVASFKAAVIDAYRKEFNQQPEFYEVTLQGGVTVLTS